MSMWSLTTCVLPFTFINALSATHRGAQRRHILTVTEEGVEARAGVLSVESPGPPTPPAPSSSSSEKCRVHGLRRDTERRDVKNLPSEDLTQPLLFENGGAGRDRQLALGGGRRVPPRQRSSNNVQWAAAWRDRARETRQWPENNKQKGVSDSGAKHRAWIGLGIDRADQNVLGTPPHHHPSKQAKGARDGADGDCWRAPPLKKLLNCTNLAMVPSVEVLACLSKRREEYSEVFQVTQGLRNHDVRCSAV
ncbi:hypothetical protein BJV74DRAFT_799816 [Russula compacta]|nr:hypothetical protein BJV74DRAFT_799816 [Russula compacta]